MAGRSKKPPGLKSLSVLGAPERYPFDTYIRMLVRWGWDVRAIVDEVSQLGLLSPHRYEEERESLISHTEQVHAYYYRVELPRFSPKLDRPVAKKEGKAQKRKVTPVDLRFIEDSPSRAEYVEFCTERHLDLAAANPDSHRLNATRQLCLSGPVRDYLEIALVRDPDFKETVEGVKRLIDPRASLTQQLLKDWYTLFWNFQRVGARFKRGYIESLGKRSANMMERNPQALLSIEFGYVLSLSDAERVKNLAAIAYEHAMLEGYHSEANGVVFSVWGGTHSKLVDHARALDPSSHHEQMEHYVFDAGETPLLLHVDHIQSLEEKTIRLLEPVRGHDTQPQKQRQALKEEEEELDGEHDGAAATNRVGAEVVPFRRG